MQERAPVTGAQALAAERMRRERLVSASGAPRHRQFKHEPALAPAVEEIGELLQPRAVASHYNSDSLRYL